MTPIKQAPNYGTVGVIPPTAFPATIAAGVTYSSDLMPAGFGAVVACATLDQTGVLTVQRYADLAGQVPVGALMTQNMTAGVGAFAGVADGLPYLTFQVTIQNTSGSLGHLTNAKILTGPL